MRNTVQQHYQEVITPAHQGKMAAGAARNAEEEGSQYFVVLSGVNSDLCQRCVCFGYILTMSVHSVAAAAVALATTVAGTASKSG